MVSVADNATGSPQTAALSAGTAPAVAGRFACRRAPLSFGNVVTGYNDCADSRLGEYGQCCADDLGDHDCRANPADFAETTTCGESLAAGATCTISVTFTPGSVASFTATVSVADNAAGSPQTVTLSGAGIAAPDFTVSATPAAEAVSNGGVATYQVSVGEQ